MQNFDLEKENGRSMIEMLGVLAIIGVLSVGGIAGYSKAMTKYRINKTIEQITLIAGNVRTFFAPQKSYEGLMKKTTAAGGSITVYMSDATVARKAKLVPEDMWEYNNDGTFKQFTGAFGGRVSLSATKKSLTDDNKAFSISYYIGDSAEACIEILSHDWATANVTAVSISGGNGHGGTRDSKLKLPASMDLIINKCSYVIAGSEDGYGQLLLYFDIEPDTYNFPWDN